jgi:hypothetical protein
MIRDEVICFLSDRGREPNIDPFCLDSRIVLFSTCPARATIFGLRERDMTPARVPTEK